MSDTAGGKPCDPCPWTSKDQRDIDAISDPVIDAAMKAGEWFACHGRGGGTCFGARLRYEAHQRAIAREAAGL